MWHTAAPATKSLVSIGNTGSLLQNSNCRKLANSTWPAWMPLMTYQGSTLHCVGPGGDKPEAMWFYMTSRVILSWHRDACVTLEVRKKRTCHCSAVLCIFGIHGDCFLIIWSHESVYKINLLAQLSPCLPQRCIISPHSHLKILLCENCAPHEEFWAVLTNCHLKHRKSFLFARIEPQRTPWECLEKRIVCTVHLPVSFSCSCLHVFHVQMLMCFSGGLVQGGRLQLLWRV